MRYIDAEKLITIIEERKAQQDQWINRYHDPINQGISHELNEILSIIASLKQEQPSLPSELDEAAENSWAVYEYRESPRGLYSTCYLDGFKDGAEWMAGQGETHELTVERPVLGPPMICCPVHADNGDKVVVQIRKK